jgi:type II secretory pathway component PulC
MKDNISPEEKLLRLIRGKKKSRIPVLAENNPNSLLPVKIQGGIVNQKRVFKFKKYLPQLNLNILILIGFVSASLYLLSAFIYPLLVTKKAIFLPEKPFAKITESREAVKQEEIKPYDFYTQGIENKQIFGAASAQLMQESGVTVGANLIKDINLLGVISGVSPQAIIEDKKSQKTYYVNKGQMIGEFQVEDIGDGKVILNYSGQRFELSI